MKNPKEQPVEVFNFDQIDHLLLLGIAASGLRIGEALALKWTDFKNNVLYVTRRIYDGDVDAVKSKRSERRLPIDHSHGARMEKLGEGEWVFRSRTGSPVNPGNALKATFDQLLRNWASRWPLTRSRRSHTAGSA